jgi:prepilin peptidase CpaA
MTLKAPLAGAAAGSWPSSGTSVLWITLAFLVGGMLWDLRRREIPDIVPLALLALAVTARVMQWSAAGWVSLALGFSLGAAIGLLLFWSGGFGGGDVKVLAALGAIVGPRDLVSVFVYIALVGAVLALIAWLRGQRDFAYSPALMLGFAVFLVARGLW